LESRPSVVYSATLGLHDFPFRLALWMSYKPSTHYGRCDVGLSPQHTLLGNSRLYVSEVSAQYLQNSAFCSIAQASYISEYSINMVAPTGITVLSGNFHPLLGINAALSSNLIAAGWVDGKTLFCNCVQHVALFVGKLHRVTARQVMTRLWIRFMKLANDQTLCQVRRRMRLVLSSAHRPLRRCLTLCCLSAALRCIACLIG